MFLTRLPVPRWIGHSDAQLARSTVYFPLVGALVGGIGALVFVFARQLWSQEVAVLLSMATTIVLTGAFHEDGLADACDGLGAGWTPEQILTIFKDSRLGTYGTVGLWLALSLKWSLLNDLADQVPMALWAGHVLGRWSSLPLIWGLSYVRSEGTGKPFAAQVTGPRLFLGTFLALALLMPALGEPALFALPVALLITCLAGAYFRHRLGGITGDCLGAANQLVELSTYLTLAAVFGLGSPFENP